MEQFNFNTDDKFIICQPLGGLNDMLCQIGHCIEYAEKFNRKLIIDTKMVSDMADHFSNYFELIQPNNFIYSKLETDDIKTIHNHPARTMQLNLIHDYSDPKLNSIDINTDFNEKFILHRAFGGGLQSAYALRYFRLLPQIADEIKNRKQSLGDYRAVLIRHTDYQTDYQAVLLEIKELGDDSPLYVFTDSCVVQDFAKCLGFTKLLINENLQRIDDKYLPIMHVRNVIPTITMYQVNCQVLTDLFLAAMSNHIYPTYIVGYRGDRQFENKKVKSGFINLAIELNRDRMLLDRLLCKW